jgi:hypothetical protein
MVMLAVSAAAAGQNTPPRGSSTPEERARAVAIAHKLEAAPLDQSLTPEREWALRWLIEVPDVTVKVCAGVLGRDFLRTKYKYSSNLVVQFTLSSAAFILEHPDKAGHQVATYTAGAEGVLKAYAAILRENPRAKWKALDDPLEKQGQGQLADYVRENSRTCK